MDDDEIYNIACSRGYASLDGLKKALENHLFKGDVLVYMDGENTPLFFATVGWGMMEHTELLVQYGADLNQLSQGSDNKQEHLISHLFSALPEHKAKKKLEILLKLETLGMKWNAYLDPNFLHDLLKSTDLEELNKNSNKLIFNYLLQKPSILDYDYNPKTKQYAIELAISHRKYEVALKLAKNKFCYKIPNQNIFFTLIHEFPKYGLNENQEKYLNKLTVFLTQKIKINLQDKNQQGLTILEALDEKSHDIDSFDDGLQYQNWKDLFLKSVLTKEIKKTSQKKTKNRI